MCPLALIGCVCRDGRCVTLETAIATWLVVTYVGVEFSAILEALLLLLLVGVDWKDMEIDMPESKEPTEPRRWRVSPPPTTN